MKSFTVVILMLVMVVSVSLAHAEEMTKLEGCSQWSQMAEQIMELRQEGLPMRKAMEKMGETKGLKWLIEEAYGEIAMPDYLNSRKKQQVEFGNYVYKTCMKKWTE